jgi:hypothetical protein
MSKMTIGQNGAVYWRDDALSVDYIVRAFNDRADQIQRLERERDEWRAKAEAHIRQPPRWPSPEDAAKYRQDWLAENRGGWEWDAISGDFTRTDHTAAMAAIFDWIKKGCPDE